MSLRLKGKRSIGVLAVLPVFIFLLLAAGCDSFFPSENAIDHITVTPASRFMTVGDTPQQYTATAVTGNGASSDVSSTATWTSSNTSVATVSSTGLVTAVAAGTANIIANSGGAEGSSPLNVTASTLNSITISPANSTVVAGSTLQFNATGNFKDPPTQDITSLVTWTSSDTTIATISTSGLATGVKAGTVTITATATATAGPITVTTQLTVQ